MKDTILKMLNNLKDDVTFYIYKDIIHVTIDDWVGFDDDYQEIFRDYTDPDGVDKLLNYLDKYNLCTKGDLYTTYYFQDCIVKVGYSSFDI
jgi:hypothetical protein